MAEMIEMGLQHKRLESKVIITSDKGIHLDYFEPTKEAASICGGKLKGNYAYLEYDPRQDFCDIQDLGDLPNIDMNEKVEIFNKLTYQADDLISLRQLVSCPCVLETQRLYAIDLSNMTTQDFDRHTCTDCPCCISLSNGQHDIRYDIAPLYQKLPKYRSSEVVQRNSEYSPYGRKLRRRILLDVHNSPTDSVDTNAEDDADFKEPLQSSELVREKKVLKSGTHNGIAINPGHPEVVEYWGRKQRQTLRRWYGNALDSTA